MKSITFLNFMCLLTLAGAGPSTWADTLNIYQFADPMTGFLTEVDINQGLDSLTITPPAAALSLTTEAAARAAAKDARAAQENTKPVFAAGEKIPLPQSRPKPDSGPTLKLVDAVKRAKFTVYNPNVNDNMEGGPKNRYSEPINSIEDAAKNGRPVTLAADAYNRFGSACNQRQRRCLILVLAPNFDSMFPEYRKKFTNLPRNSFLGIVEDTGDAFNGSNGTHFDIAVRNRHWTFGRPLTFVSARWLRINNPCGLTSRGRNCNLAEARLEPTTLAMVLN